MGILRDTYIVNNNTDTSRISYEMSRKNDIEESQKQKEVIDKIFSRITLWKMEDITMETSKVLDDLLDILKEVSE